jgi:RsiW-degrading membrane proteinase PrsW (M82 family)
MNWLLLAIAPGIAISLYIILKDEYNKEPRKHLLFSFLLGMAAIFPALVIESMLNLVQVGPFYKTIPGISIKAYFSVALVEELSKFFMLYAYAYRQPEFDEPFDGIVYAVMVGMGFATLENIFYVYQYGMATGWVRMFMAVPAHASFAILMGYFMGRAKFNHARERQLIVAGIFWASFFHGSYDFFLFLQENQLVVSTISSSLLILGAVISLIIGVLLSKKAITAHLAISRQTFKES